MNEIPSVCDELSVSAFCLLHGGALSRRDFRKISSLDTEEGDDKLNGVNWIRLWKRRV